VNKQDLVAKIAEDTGLTRVTAWAAIESALDGIVKALKKGDTVTLVGFGTFKTAARKARTGVNHATGAPLKIPKRTVAKFTPGAALKKNLNSKP
jgi:DNA-binding protein HU-beta